MPWGRGAQPRALAPQVAAVLTLPFDVVKTQRQIELGGSEMHPGEGASCGAGGDSGEPPPAPPNPPFPSPPAVAASKPSSTWLLMRRIRAESGTRGLFAGEAVTPPHPFLGFWGAPVSSWG